MNGSSSNTGPRKAKLMHISFASDASHAAAYVGNIKSFDLNRMRVPKDTPVDTTIAKQIYKAMKTYPGEKGFEVTTHADLIKYLPQAVADGHTFIEYNLEEQFVPDLLPSGHEANSNHLEAFTVAAQVAHQRGLKISAAPTRNIVDSHGTQIASTVDMIHLQLQKFQELDPQLLRNWLNSNVPKLKAANPKIEIFIQFSTSWLPAPGLSMLDTFKRFTNTVYSVPAATQPNGIGYWVKGDANMAMIGDWLRWYNRTMRSQIA